VAPKNTSDKSPPRASVEALKAADAQAWRSRIADQKEFSKASKSTPCGPPPLTREQQLRAAEHQATCQLCGPHAPFPPRPCPELDELLRSNEQDALWEQAAAIEQRRIEQESNGKLPHDDRALARLRELREGLAVFVLNRPTPPTAEEYADYVRQHFTPGYNAIASHDRMCVECGKLFAVRDGYDGKAATCDTTCANLARTREWRKQNEETHAAQAERLRRAIKECQKCDRRHRRLCDVHRERLESLAKAERTADALPGAKMNPATLEHALEKQAIDDRNQTFEDAEINIDTAWATAKKESVTP
jgi:hypothetical protein